MQIPNAVIFSVLRIIKQGNPGDTYYEAYKSHLAKRGESFYDLYHYFFSPGMTSCSQQHGPSRIFSQLHLKRFTPPIFLFPFVHCSFHPAHCLLAHPLR